MLAAGTLWRVGPTLAVDLDGDSDSDVVAAMSESTDGATYWSTDAQVVGVWSNDGAGGFPRIATLPSPAPGEVPSALDVADVDGDGIVDLVAAADQALGWYPGLGGGAFGPNTLVDDAAGVASAARATDLDGDGDADLVVAVRSGLWWYRNLGAGAFASSLELYEGAVVGFAADDLDRDGDVDLVVATADQVVRLDARGDGSFDELVVSQTGGVGVAIGDLDGDGLGDLAVNGRDDVSWFPSSAAAGSASVVDSYGFADTGVALVDLDADGDADLVVVGGVNAWLENDDGGFGAPRPLWSLGSRYPLSFGPAAIADLDGDGDDDVVSGDLVVHANQCRF
jgi:hypothetical protein